MIFSAGFIIEHIYFDFDFYLWVMPKTKLSPWSFPNL